MKRFLFSLIVIFFINFSPVNAAGGGTYINELSAIKPYDRVPIPVWIQNTAYFGVAHKAFAEWARASGGCVKFTHANSPQNARIKVHFVKSLGPTTAGVTYPFSNSQYTVSSDIQIAVYPAGRTVPLSNEEAFRVIVHEIGHALGLQGHSSNRNDIMYPDTSVIGIYASSRDYNTIRRIYCRH